MQVGERVKSLREGRGWSQGELLVQARRHLPAGEIFSRATLSRLENGHRMPGSGILRALAAALDVSMEYLLTGEERQVTGEGGEPLPLPQAELVRLVIRLNALAAEDRERLAGIMEDLLDLVVDLARSERALYAPEEDPGFEMDEDDRALDTLLRSSGLDDTARTVVWASIEERTRKRRRAK